MRDKKYTGACCYGRWKYVDNFALCGGWRYDDRSDGMGFQLVRMIMNE